MKKAKKILSILLSVVICASMLVGCNSSKPSSNSSSASSSQATDGKITVTDMAGRTVEVPAEINSIGTFGAVGVINTFVELMGCGDKICNEMPANFTKNDKWKMQYEFAPQIKDAPLFEDPNGEIIMETVLETKPDLCITMMKDKVEILEKKGLTVIYLEWNETEDVKTAVKLMGDVLNKKDVAEEYIKYFDETIKKAEDLAANIKDDDKKTVLYGSVSQLTQPHVIAEWWIKEAGGISVTDDGRTEDSKYTYTLEDLLKWNPDVMIVSDKSEIEEIKKDSRLAEITAVKDSAIYPIPTVGHNWGNRTVEQPLTILWAMNKIYPDVVTEKDLADEIKNFYQKFFNYSLSDEQVDEIINYGE